MGRFIFKIASKIKIEHFKPDEVLFQLGFSLHTVLSDLDSWHISHLCPTSLKSSSVAIFSPLLPCQISGTEGRIYVAAWVVMMKLGRNWCVGHLPKGDRRDRIG